MPQQEVRPPSAIQAETEQTIPRKMEVLAPSKGYGRRVHLYLSHQEDGGYDAIWERYQIGPITVWIVKLGKQWRRLIFYSVMAFGAAALLANLAKIVSGMQFALSMLPRAGG